MSAMRAGHLPLKGATNPPARTGLDHRDHKIHSHATEYLYTVAVRQQLLSTFHHSGMQRAWACARRRYLEWYLC